MTDRTLKAILLSTLLLLLVLPALSQRERVKVYGTTGDSIDCGPGISAYRTFFKLKLYQEAYPTWLKVFKDCPAFSEMIYLDGATMYRDFIEARPEGAAREGLIDTLMLIYDRRMAYFGGEGNVLGRKGTDLLTYRGSDVEQMEKAHALLRKSIELTGKDSRESVMLLCISSGIALNREEILEDSLVLEDYLMIMGNILRQESRSENLERTRERIDDLMLQTNVLSCEALNQFYTPQFNQYRKDKFFLETLFYVYTTAGCMHSEIYEKASEELYRIGSGPEYAHHMAIRFITRNELEKAAVYLKEALEGDRIENETRALWYYELAVVSQALKDYCKAIDYARESIHLKADYGKAYMMLGDAYIASRENLGDEIQRQTAFWAAADQYMNAARVDPSLEEETSQKLQECALQYPSPEDLFFLEIHDGDPYRIGGCINDSTTVRSGK